MSGGSGDHHVVCIEAKQICDFCFQEERIERTFTVDVGRNERVAVECEVDTANVRCREIERRELEGRKGKFLVCLAVEVPVMLTVGTEEVQERVVFLKQAVLNAPDGTDVECQVSGNCCCFLDRETSQVSCVFNFCIVIQSKVTVRLLVPTLGFCAPKECRAVVGGCPPTLPPGCPSKDLVRDDRDCCD